MWTNLIYMYVLHISYSQFSFVLNCSTVELNLLNLIATAQYDSTVQVLCDQAFAKMSSTCTDTVQL